MLFACERCHRHLDLSIIFDRRCAHGHREGWGYFLDGVH
jgi:hypothetical protein